MEAPDKIYLSVRKGEDWAYAMWTQKTPEEQKFSKLDEHEEYIRKDALLEWAKKNNKRIDAEEGDYSLGYVSAMIDLIEKIESL